MKFIKTVSQKVLSVLFPIRPLEIARLNIFAGDSTVRKYQLTQGQVFKTFNY